MNQSLNHKSGNSLIYYLLPNRLYVTTLDNYILSKIFSIINGEFLSASEKGDVEEISECIKSIISAKTIEKNKLFYHHNEV